MATAEKQALLEAPDLKTRAEILVAVTEIELAKKTVRRRNARCSETDRAPSELGCRTAARYRLHDYAL